MTKAKGTTTKAESAAKRTSKRRTDYRINVKGYLTVEQQEDGRWLGRFPVYDLSAYGATEQEARDEIYRQLVDRRENGTDEEKREWHEFAQANIIEVEISEEEYQAELAERRKQKRYPSSKLPQLTPETFDDTIASSTPTLVDYWAQWCEPCHMMAPVLHELKDKLAGQLNVCAVDVEKYEPLWERFDLKGIPTLIVFKDGDEVKRILGTRSLDELLAELEPVLG